VYELPIAAIRCPVCGSKRLRRLYNAINVNGGTGKKVDAFVEGPVTAAYAQHDEAKAAERKAPTIAVPIHRIGETLARIGLGAVPVGIPAGKAVISSSVAHPVEGIIRQRPPRPGAGTRVDTEFAIRKRADGTGEPVKV